MKLRPCIDLHQGLVKQIVGSTLKDDTNSVEGGDKQQQAEEGTNNEPQQQQEQDLLATNFTTTLPSSHYARLYQTDRLTGGHVIMLGGGNDEAARLALSTYPGGLQIGGGITLDNCHTWLAAGASHVIVTSFVFTDGHVRLDRLEALRTAIGKERLVLDLSCRRRPPRRRKKLEDGDDDAADQVDEEESDDTNYYVVTDKWQTFTNVVVDAATLTQLAAYCDEFLVHGVDVEGLQCGILEDLVQLLGAHSPIPACYAGGVRSLADLDLVDRLGGGRVDCTVGSALDIFGGSLPYADVVAWHHRRNQQR